MLVEVRVQSLGMDTVTNHPVVVLQEISGSRVLPIWIGPSEASAIATHLAKLPVSRPFTHDLLVSILGGMGGAVRKAVITRVVDSTYYAELIIQRNGQTLSVDARPSDSIAIALRTHAEIFADDSLMDSISVQVGNEPIPADQAQTPQPPEAMSPEELKEYLKRMHPEDFGRFTP